MNTFYLVLRVVPTPDNHYVNQVAGALASCWVCDDDPVSAVAAASFKVRQQEWEIVNLEESPNSVAEDDYVDKEIALERYRAAQGQGMSMVFAAWSTDEKTSFGPIELKKPNDFILSEYLSEIGALKRKGTLFAFRCCRQMHRGNRRALDSEKRGSILSRTKREIYAPSKNFGDTKRGKGRITFKEQGVNKVSTFRGFCGKHDNELFEPIDNSPLAPTPEQIALYAYRSLCREVFVKENAVALDRIER